MDHSPEEAPLASGSLAGSEEALVIPPVAPRGGSNSRALKIAGLTTLACLLLASQVFTAYMVFDQKQQIHSLQKNSERLGKQLARPPHAMSPMRMPMGSLPLMADFTSDEDPKTTKTPLTKLEDTAVVSVTKQLRDLLQDFQLPQFNETFLGNLKSLREQTDDSEWKSFQTWMRYWLIFQMAQQNPATPTSQPAPLIMTKCQTAAAVRHHRLGTFKPQCDEQGHYRPIQCWHATGFCWCVDDSGATIEGTAVRGHPDCQRGAVPRRGMVAPMLMQTDLVEGH